MAAINLLVLSSIFTKLSDWSIYKIVNMVNERV